MCYLIQLLKERKPIRSRPWSKEFISPLLQEVEDDLERKGMSGHLLLLPAQLWLSPSCTRISFSFRASLFTSFSTMWFKQDCSVQFSHSVVSASETLWIAAWQASLSIIDSRGLLKLMSIESVMPSNHLILCHPLLLPPSIFSSIRIFSNKSALPIRWPNYWSFSFSINSSKEHLGLISFRID